MVVGKTPYQKIREVFEKRGLSILPTQVSNALPVETDELISGMCAFEPSDRLKLPDLIDLIHVMM